MDYLKNLSDKEVARERYSAELLSAINQGTYPEDQGKYHLYGKKWYEVLDQEYERRKLDLIFDLKKEFLELHEVFKK